MKLFTFISLCVVLSGCSTLQGKSGIQECRKLCADGQAQSYKDEFVECSCQ